RPVYSYRLSIIHFWALIFLYIWAGPHHLHYTALPDWTQTLGMTFSINDASITAGLYVGNETLLPTATTYRAWVWEA
ncbi:MAG TPA: cbb3-type cytochrome c oxidase subunit I, partial [Terracidiphilus sp.]